MPYLITDSCGEASVINSEEELRDFVAQKAIESTARAETVEILGDQVKAIFCPLETSVVEELNEPFEVTWQLARFEYQPILTNVNLTASLNPAKAQKLVEFLTQLLSFKPIIKSVKGGYSLVIPTNKISNESINITVDSFVD